MDSPKYAIGGPHSSSQLFQRFLPKNLHHGETLGKTVRSCEEETGPRRDGPLTVSYLTQFTAACTRIKAHARL